jgi:hypothetical protein
LAPEESPDDETLVNALLRVGTEGVERTKTVLIIGSRFGLACHDYKTALRRRLQLEDPEVRELTTQLEIDESGEPTDEGYVEAERRAHEVERILSDTSAEAIRGKMTESAAAYGETGETLWHSWTTLLVTMLSGGNPYYTAAAPAMLGVDAEELGGHSREDGTIVLDPGGGFGPLGPLLDESLATFGSFNMARIRQVIDDVPAADLARLAPQLRPMSRVLAAIFRIPFDADRDEAAACFVPMLLAIGTDAVARFAAMGTFLTTKFTPPPEAHP